jgi:DNA-directed RNA polymerase
MWMIKPKNKTWENAILSNKKNYEFDGLPRLKPPVYDKHGFYEDGTAAIRGTHKDDVEKMLKGRSSNPAINNLNYEAATGIKVNKYVLDTQTELERRGVGIGKVVPKKSTSKLDVSARSERQAWDSKRSIARALKDDVFYNGMSNDKYARTYSTNLGLQWQGDHVSKGLMLFDKGVKMGKYGEDAFKQEFINVSLNGFDKLPIKVRRQVYDMIPDKMIRDVIKDPVKNDWWYTKTDWFEAGLLKKDLKGIPKEWAGEIRKLATTGEPDGAWNFLSLLKERDEMIAWKKAGKSVDDFVSYKQLQVDGTTNVLQHLSGISRDSAMADRVNMVVRPKVADAYIAVRDQLDTIARRMDDGDPLKRFIDQDLLQLAHSKRRKSVKKGLMTYQYNAGPATLGDSYFEALESVMVNGKPIFKTASKSDRLAVGRLIAQASDEVFPNSGNVKSLLNNFAEAHEIAGKQTIEFKTELGFPFRQQYKKKGVRQLSIPDGNGGVMKLNLSIDLDEIDWSKQNRAFAPNIIHSMDATHKSMVVNKLKEKYGVETFSMIHDSFGSSGGHMKALNLVTREAFQDLYKDRVFMRELYDSFSRQGVPMKRFVRNETGGKIRYVQGTRLLKGQERFVRDGRQWIIEEIPMKEVMQQGDFDFKKFTELEYFFH